MKPMTPEEVAARIRDERGESTTRIKKQYKPSTIGQWKGSKNERS